jgi:hypothetical protein
MPRLVTLALGFAAGLLAGWLHARREPHERGPRRP